MESISSLNAIFMVICHKKGRSKVALSLYYALSKKF